MNPVEVSHISKSFGSTQAVRNVSFEVAQGEIFGLLGPNGAGKTTTIRVMLDIFKPESGTVSILGGPMSEEKKDLIGIGRTLIAKPWRREVYLQMARWPHPVLGHEVVHAVLSEAGRGPFAVAATWGGLIPNPGIIEGAAGRRARVEDLATRPGFAVGRSIASLPGSMCLGDVSSC